MFVDRYYKHFGGTLILLLKSEVQNYVLVIYIIITYIFIYINYIKMYGSDYELLITKFRLKLKKVGKTTRPFRYDLNQIPYSYTVEVMNRFKELDLIECLENYGLRFVTLYRRKWSRPSPRKRNAKRQNGCLKRPYK